MKIDLHMHTVHSDGVLEPAALLALVRESGLDCFAVTDHDTLAGYVEMKQLLTLSDPELITGVELSVAAEGEDMHMLAYLFDPDSVAMNEALSRFREQRSHRGRQMVDKLHELGVELPFEEVERKANGAPIGRPHIADALLSLRLVGSFEQAFYKYIGNEAPAYVPKAKLQPREAIELVHQAGGVTVMAHPKISGMYRYIEELAGLGLDGVEMYHPRHKRPDRQQLRTAARRFGLIVTGGSDFHGRSDREGEIGSQPVPADCVDQLKKRAEEIRGTL